MRILVTWGSKRGGTAGIGRILGEALAAKDFDVVAVPVDEVRDLATFDAVIVGGALYANRWAASARRFVSRHVKELRKVPVWFFSSGPLDDSAARGDLPPTTQVAVLAERVGAQGHVTFGGRLEPDAKGFPASAMARKMSGDWRDPDRVRAWADGLARVLPEARPRLAVDPPARSLGRLVAHGVVGWALCGAVMAALLQLAGPTTAIVLHALAAPAIFVVLARHYFGGRGARDPLPTAMSWTAIVAVLDLVVVAGALRGSLAPFFSFGAVGLPLALILVATWATGEILSTMPWEKRGEEPHNKAA